MNAIEISFIRKAIIVFVLCLPVLVVSSQGLKSAFMVSGNFSYNKDITKTVYDMFTAKTYVKTFSLQPKVGYFLFSRVCVGTYLPFQWSIEKISNDQKLKDKSFGIGPFVKYYQPITKGLYGVANLGFYWSKEINQYADIDFNPPPTINIMEAKETTKASVVGIGVSYFINQSIAIELMADYVSKFTDDSGDPPYVYKDNFNMNLGLQVYFLKKSNE